MMNHLVRVPHGPCDMGQYKDGDHREDAPHFTSNDEPVIVKSLTPNPFEGYSFQKP